jgi:hypothetical protein
LVLSVLLALATCDSATNEPSDDPVTAKIRSEGLDGTWYFQGEGILPTHHAGWSAYTDWPDSRLVFDATSKTMSFYHRAGPTTVCDWTTDTSWEVDSIASIGDGLVTATVTSATVDSDNQLGSTVRPLYQIVDDELHLWWVGAPDGAYPYTWCAFTVYRRARPSEDTHDPAYWGSTVVDVATELADTVEISFTTDQTGSLEVHETAIPRGTDIRITALTSQPVDVYRWYLDGRRIEETDGPALVVGAQLVSWDHVISLIAVKGSTASSADFILVVE